MLQLASKAGLALPKKWRSFLSLCCLYVDQRIKNSMVLQRLNPAKFLLKQNLFYNFCLVWLRSGSVKVSLMGEATVWTCESPCWLVCLHAEKRHSAAGNKTAVKISRCCRKNEIRTESFHFVDANILSIKLPGEEFPHKNSSVQAQRS